MSGKLPCGHYCSHVNCYREAIETENALCAAHAWERFALNVCVVVMVCAGMALMWGGDLKRALAARKAAAEEQSVITQGPTFYRDVHVVRP